VRSLCVACAPGALPRRMAPRLRSQGRAAAPDVPTEFCRQGSYRHDPRTKLRISCGFWSHDLGLRDTLLLHVYQRRSTDSQGSYRHEPRTKFRRSYRFFFRALHVHACPPPPPSPGARPLVRWLHEDVCPWVYGGPRGGRCLESEGVARGFTARPVKPSAGPAGLLQLRSLSGIVGLTGMGGGGALDSLAAEGPFPGPSASWYDEPFRHCGIDGCGWGWRSRRFCRDPLHWGA